MDPTTPVSTTSLPTAPYSRHAPSPPFIHVTRACVDPIQKPLRLIPSFSSVDPGTLTEEELRIIVGDLEHTAVDRSVSWAYPMRHAAQSILDFLYVGPQSVVRDTEWLRSESVTMAVLAHDLGFGSIIGSFVQRCAAPLGIETVLVPVASSRDLMTSFDDIIRAINQNVVGVYRKEGRKGKVLVTCQTGNDRATVIAAAYLMSVFGVGLVDAVNFVMAQRFCANFDEESKRCLEAWEAILKARKDVHGAKTESGAFSAGMGMAVVREGAGKKRRIEDTRDEEDEGMMDVSAGENMDADRYHGRGAFIPFVDTED